MRVTSRQGGLPSGWSHEGGVLSVGVVSHQGGLPSGWSHEGGVPVSQGGLSSGQSHGNRKSTVSEEKNLLKELEREEWRGVDA